MPGVLLGLGWGTACPAAGTIMGKGIPVQSSLRLTAICRLVLALPKPGWQ